MVHPPQGMTQDQIIALLPADIGARVTSATHREGAVTLVVDAAGLDTAERTGIERTLHDRLVSEPDISAVRVVLTAERAMRRILAVASGKGGVGKSTLAANLAIALADQGVKVGLVDADIYGPSQPLIMDTPRRKPEVRDDKLVPLPGAAGIPVLSIGHIVPPGRALAWRGPMASGALGQLIDADWGDAEWLVVDLPPGTGDVQLTMIQKHKPAGAVLVSTPQDLALIDAVRAGQLFDQVGVPVVGLVENMAGYACPHCGEISDPFGAGGVEKAAQQLELPFLGRIPLRLSIREGGDAGRPPAASGEEEAEPFHTIARKIAAWMREAVR